MIARRRSWLLARTLPRLGLANVGTVAAYRLAARRGWIAHRQDRPLPPVRFTAVPADRCPPDHRELAGEADEWREGRLRMFGRLLPFDADAPDWHVNRLSGAPAPADLPWWRISDADGAIGDIKGVWEASRFDWALLLARIARTGDDGAAVARLNHLLADWTRRNPPFLGANWMCGQEASIRLLQLLLAARLLDQDHGGTGGLVSFVAAHLDRIAPTRFYARAQDNNHGTSEATALFIGGAWLAVHGGEALRRRGSRLAGIGRQMLEERCRRLVFDDGGFSQYSTTYHRVLLDTLCQAELWRRRLRQPPFSEGLRRRAAAATFWLARLTNGRSGDAPNLGANDGARLFRLDSLPYRDFRPSVQLAGALFCHGRIFPAGPWDAPCHWLGVDLPASLSGHADKKTTLFPDFGLLLLNPRPDGQGSYAFLRFPSNRFRPSQADPLHVDLWSAAGVALLRDGGTGSYSPTAGLPDLSGIGAHNSLQFDGREPMVRLSRFLWAPWLRGRCEPLGPAEAPTGWRAGYTDAAGVRHSRTLDWRNGEWRIADRADGPFDVALLRWRLSGPVTLTSNACATNGQVELCVESDGPPPSIGIVEAHEALAYGVCETVPALIARFASDWSEIRTRIRVAADADPSLSPISPGGDARFQQEQE